MEQALKQLAGAALGRSAHRYAGAYSKRMESAGTLSGSVVVVAG